MTTRRLLFGLAASLACAACRTPVVPDPHPDPTRYDVWTTPPPGEDAPRLARAPAPSAPRTSLPSGWRADAELTVANRYVWRGQLLVDDPVLQPAANLSYGDFRLNVWGNLDLTNVNGNAGQFTEVDVALEWLHAFDDTPIPFRVFAGAAGYFFPNLPFEPTAEIYGGVAFGVPANPTFTVYRDVALIDGTYVSFHLEDRVEIGPFTLAGKAGIAWADRGYNRGYFNVDRNGFNDFHAVLSLPWSRGRWTVKPFVAWYSLVEGSIRRATAKSDSLVYGLTVGATL